MEVKLQELNAKLMALSNKIDDVIYSEKLQHMILEMQEDVLSMQMISVKMKKSKLSIEQQCDIVKSDDVLEPTDTSKSNGGNGNAKIELITRESFKAMRNAKNLTAKYVEANTGVPMHAVYTSENLNLNVKDEYISILQTYYASDDYNKIATRDKSNDSIDNIKVCRANFKKLRLRKNISGYKVAEIVGVSDCSIYSAENVKKYAVSKDMINRISKFYMSDYYKNINIQSNNKTINMFPKLNMIEVCRDNFKLLRNLKNLSAVKMGMLIGISQKTIYKAENVDNDTVSNIMIKRITYFFNSTVYKKMSEEIKPSKVKSNQTILNNASDDLSGIQLRLMRLKRKLTQLEVCNAIQISAPTLSRLECDGGSRLETRLRVFNYYNSL